MGEELERKVKKCLLRLMRERPFYGYFLLQMDIVPSTDIPTACTDGTVIKYNPSFFKQKDEGFVQMVLEHEVMHIVLFHIPRMRGKDPHIWNVATDWVIQKIQEERDNTKIPSAEEIYESLLDKQREAPSDPGPHEITLPVVSSSSWESEVKQRVVSAVTAAVYSSTKDRVYGTVPSPIARTLRALVEPPKVNWQTTLSQYLTVYCDRVQTWKRPSKRSSLYLPSWQKTKGLYVVLALDVSGSIPDKLLTEFVNECKSLLSLFQVTGIVCQFDTQIQKIEPLSEASSIFSIRYGDGGTSFVPIFDLIEKESLHEDYLVIIFTDLYGAFPEKAPTYPVLWIVKDPQTSPPFGDVVPF